MSQTCCANMAATNQPIWRTARAHDSAQFVETPTTHGIDLESNKSVAEEGDRCVVPAARGR